MDEITYFLQPQSVGTDALFAEFLLVNEISGIPASPLQTVVDSDVDVFLSDVTSIVTGRPVNEATSFDDTTNFVSTSIDGGLITAREFGQAQIFAFATASATFLSDGFTPIVLDLNTSLDAIAAADVAFFVEVTTRIIIQPTDGSDPDQFILSLTLDSSDETSDSALNLDVIDPLDELLIDGDLALDVIEADDTGEDTDVLAVIGGALTIFPVTESLIYVESYASLSVSLDFDPLIGALGDDVEYGTTDADLIQAQRVYASWGDDVVEGTALADVHEGGSGNDTLFGFAGNDSLSGGFGDDELLGGDGSDNLIGGDGDDTIISGAGRYDRMDGGGGADSFVIGAEASNGIRERDVIYNFDFEEDRIELRDGAEVDDVRTTSRGVVITLKEDGDAIIIYGDGATADNVMITSPAIVPIFPFASPTAIPPLLLTGTDGPDLLIGDGGTAVGDGVVF